MKAQDIFLFLVGHRGAIRRVAGSRAALAVGAVLCMSAGIARHYDGRAFIDAPWKLLICIGVALLNASIIYLFVGPLIARQAGEHDAAQSRYLPWLTCFLMTAPCAWLYALPVELWTNPVTATKLNMALLGVVSLWRVALMARTAQVIGGLPLRQAAAAIVLPAGSIMGIAIYFHGKETMSSMMGAATSPADRWFIGIHMPLVAGLLVAAGIAFAVWLMALRDRREPAALPELLRSPLSLPALGLAVAAVVVGVVAALPTQRQVVEMARIHSLYDIHDQGPMLAALSAHQPEDFGRQLVLRPDAHRSEAIWVGRVFAAMDESTAPWVRQAYVEKIGVLTQDEDWLAFELSGVSFAHTDEDTLGLATIMTKMVQLPEGRAWITANPDAVHRVLGAIQFGPPSRAAEDAEWMAVVREFAALGVELPANYQRALLLADGLAQLDSAEAAR